ncbi:MAG: DUF192 domain-containing protein [Chloroflexota bacterium]
MGEHVNDGVVVYNTTKQAIIATWAPVTISAREKAEGLLGRTGLQDMEGLVIPRCRAIHTAGMRFPIDVLWLDRRGIVVGCAENMRPWRLAWHHRASMVIELAVGAIRRRRTDVGDHLEMRTTTGLDLI